jgi:hypothetical protein
MINRQQHYRSYLLRMWQCSDDETSAWRASLEAPGTGERRGFARLEDLFLWLQNQAGPDSQDQSKAVTVEGEFNQLQLPEIK